MKKFTDIPNSVIQVSPSQARLAEMTGYSERSVRTFLNELREKKLISWKRRGRKTNIYTIHPVGEK